MGSCGSGVVSLRYKEPAEAAGVEWCSGVGLNEVDIVDIAWEYLVFGTSGQSVQKMGVQ